MRHRYAIVAFILLLVNAPSSVRADEIITATKSTDKDGSSEVEITVKVNRLTIYGLTANRGNCQIYNTVSVRGSNAIVQFPFVGSV